MRNDARQPTIFASTKSRRRVSITPLRLLVATLLVAACAGCYYSWMYPWRTLEDSHFRLVEEANPATLSEFQESTTTDILVPAIEELEAVGRLRRESNQATIKPFAYEQQATTRSARVKQLLELAKKREVPRVYRTEYHFLVRGLRDCQLAIESLDTALNSYSARTRKRNLRKSIEFSKKAEKQLLVSRSTFRSVPSEAARFSP